MGLVAKLIKILYIGEIMGYPAKIQHYIFNDDNTACENRC